MIYSKLENKYKKKCICILLFLKITNIEVPSLIDSTKCNIAVNRNTHYMHFMANLFNIEYQQ